MWSLRLRASRCDRYRSSVGIDSDADVEEQQYHISQLGYWVDRYAISILDDERQAWYSRRSGGSDDRKFRGPTPIPDESIKALFTESLNERIPEIEEAVRPKWEYMGDDVTAITGNAFAVALLIYASKTGGKISINKDILHSNPCVEVGSFSLPGDDDARESAMWTGAVELLEDKGMLKCLNYGQKIYSLTDDGWKKAEIYIEENGIKDEEASDPYKLLEMLRGDGV